ncbi:unnamed protein product [Effrenium voratum]|nr:unnamed protein product [Effrenium voratum]
MSMLVNPEAQLLQEVMLKDQRAFAYKMLMLRRARSAPSLADAGSHAISTRRPDSQAKPTTTLHSKPTGSAPKGLTSAGRSSERKGHRHDVSAFAPGKIVYVRHRPDPFFSTWAAR